MKAKVSYYLSHPIQYFSPLLREMALEFDLKVYYFSDASIKGNLDIGFGQKVKWDVPLLDGYQFAFLKNYSKRQSLSNRMWDAINPSVIRTLFKENSSIVIVNGWSYFSNLLTIVTARLLRRKVWLRAENPLNQELNKNALSRTVKKLILRFLLFPFINKFLYIGKQSKLFFEYYGIKSSQMIYTPYAVDNCIFQEECKQLGDKENVKTKLGLTSDKPVILFAGKYIEKKRPLDLLKAFQLLPSNSACLVMIGEGPLRKEMELFIKRNNLQDIVLTGFVNQSEISRYYKAADIFVMCSGIGETWGLSVNEAMNFGLPVVLSKTCGCADDLVINNRNGFLYDEGNIQTLSNSIEKLLGNEILCKEFGTVSLQVINHYSIKHIVENMKASVG